MLISLSFESLVWAFISCYLVDPLYMHIKHNFLSVYLRNTKRRLHRISKIYHLIINLITKTMWVNNRYWSIEVNQKYLHNIYFAKWCFLVRILKYFFDIEYLFEKCFILYVVCDEYIKNSRKKTEFPIRPKFD